MKPIHVRQMKRILINAPAVVQAILETRRTFRTVFWSAAALLAGVAVAGAQEVSRPNIVLIMSDDQGWGETGYNGHPHLKTPVLDDMARTGLRFDRFYAAAPVCTPTRVSVMTGRHANRSGAFAPNYSTRPEEITIARILQDAGYRTAHFGKWHIGPVKKESPLNPARMGFDEYLSHDNFFEMDPPLSRNGEAPEIVKGESSEILIEESIRFARTAHAEGKPFFIVVWFGSPHAPYVARSEDIAPYIMLGKPLSHRFAEITVMDAAIGSFRRALDELGIRESTLVWFKSDNGITFQGGIRPEQRKEMFNGDLRGSKGDLHEGGIRVPAVIEWPAVVRSPRATSVPSVTSDILPTLLDILGLDHPDPKRPLDGVSLRSLIVDGAMTERETPIGFWKYPTAGVSAHGRWIGAELARGTTPTSSMAWVQPRPGRIGEELARGTTLPPVGNPAIDFLNFKHPVAKTENFGGAAGWMDKRYKLLQQGRTYALYDLLADPKEEHNIAADHPEIVERMKNELEAWQRCVEISLTGADYTGRQ
jgi:arylsulfatase A-like enzyme